MIFVLRTERDFVRVTEFCQDSFDLAKLVLLPSPDVEKVRQILDLGAHGALTQDAPAEAVIIAFRAALEGYVQVPADLMRGLMARVPSVPTADLEEEDVDWLQRLAAGTSIVELAQHAGYSEREMYRRLRRMYCRLGVTDRQGALVRAARWGLLDAAEDAMPAARPEEAPVRSGEVRGSRSAFRPGCPDRRPDTRG